MLAFRIIGTILLSLNLLLNLLLILAVRMNEEDVALAKIYLLLNSVCTIFIMVLMWVL